MTLVADTSALVSVAATPESRHTVLPLVFDGYDVAVPQHVIDELVDIAQYADDHGQAAQSILDKRDRIDIHDVELDPTFPLDDGENASIQLTERIDASFLYCDEYNQLALVHASLSDCQLVTTPRLLKAFVVHGDLSRADANDLLERISQARSWNGNAYVNHATSLFE